jgi:hypothetical protein
MASLNSRNASGVTVGPFTPGVRDPATNQRRFWRKANDAHQNGIR